MYIPDKNGKVLKEELEQIEKMSNIRDPRLDELDPPEEAELVFRLYWERFRGNPITYSEIKAYQEVTGIRLEPWEIDLLFKIHVTVSQYEYSQAKSK